MNRFFVIIIVFLFSSHLKAQIEIQENNATLNIEKSHIEVSDLDQDYIPDSLYYNFRDSSLVFLLSSLNFKALSMPFVLEGNRAEIGISEGFLYVNQSFMRYFNYSSFRYDKEKKDFRLIYYADEGYGPATNDGSGTSGFDLLSGEFTADWNYYDCELDSLLAIPTINETLIHPPVYLGDFTYLDIPSDSLFRHYKLLEIMNDRIKSIDLKRLIADQNIDNEIDTRNDIPTDSLVERYGVSLNTFLNFGVNTAFEPNCDYDNKIALLRQTTNYNTYIISFYLDFRKPTYLLLYLNRKSLKSHTEKITYNINQLNQ